MTAVKFSFLHLTTWIQEPLPKRAAELTLFIRWNTVVILPLTSGPVYLYLPPHWSSFQMAALFRSGRRRSGLNDDDRKPQTG